MKYKKIILLTIILVSLFAISAVSAAENVTDDIIGTDVVNEDVISMDKNEENVISVDNQNISEIGATDNNKLSATSGTFTDLANEINNANAELNLTRNYVYSTGDFNYKEGIQISKTITINGNGFTIDGNNSACTFSIFNPGVILNNVCFVNCVAEYGGAIEWSLFAPDGCLINCNFVNCSSHTGGAVNWRGNNGSIV